jgi:small subunit ribosomal protein S3
MGQKANPKALRIAVTRRWPSRWFSVKNYSQFLKEDEAIDKIIKGQFQMGTISEIRIERQRNETLVKIYAAKPGVVIGRSGKGTEELAKMINDKMPGIKAKIDVFEVKRSNSIAMVIAETVAYQIEKRLNYRKAVKMAIEKAKESGVTGVKIRVSGRLNNADIARSELYSWGSIPSQTLKANVDLANVHAKTATAGTIGVKVHTYNKIK